MYKYGIETYGFYYTSFFLFAISFHRKFVVCIICYEIYIFLFLFHAVFAQWCFNENPHICLYSYNSSFITISYMCTYLSLMENDFSIIYEEHVADKSIENICMHNSRFHFFLNNKSYSLCLLPPLLNCFFLILTWIEISVVFTFYF